MRGSTIKVGEYYQAKYYDIIPKKENNKIVKVNGKIQYEISTTPYVFDFFDKEAGASISVLTGSKGYNLSSGLSEIGLFQAPQHGFSIFTTATDVPFKVGGKVVISINNKDYSTTIQKIRYNTYHENTIVSQRLGTIDTEYNPILIDLI